MPYGQNERGRGTSPVLSVEPMSRAQRSRVLRGRTLPYGLRLLFDLGHLRTFGIISDTPSCLVLREELLKARSVFQDPLHEEPLDPSRLAVVSMLPSTVGLAFGCTASRTVEDFGRAF